MKTTTAFLLTFIFAFSAYAGSFDRYVDHMDLVSLNTIHSRIDLSVNYPGLGNGGFDNPDCFILLSDGRGITADQAESLKKKIHLADGDGILFGGSGRRINKLDPEIVDRRFFGRKALVFKMKDLGTYVTGVRISTWSPYIGLSQVIKIVFGEEREDLSFQFLRGCKL